MPFPKALEGSEMQTAPSGIWTRIASFISNDDLAQLADCISAEGQNPSSSDFPGYETKQSDGEASVLLGFGGM